MAVTANNELEKLALAPWDELNIITVKKRVDAVYSKLRKQAERCMLLAAMYAWDDAIVDILHAGYVKPGGSVTAAQLTAMLDKPNAVTKYIWKNEVRRKADRLTESILTAKENGSRTELSNAVKTATNLWTRQTTQFMIEAVHFGMESAYRRSGVEQVEWRTQRDDRVCSYCEPLDGLKFTLASIPIRHYRCRCYTVPVR